MWPRPGYAFSYALMLSLLGGIGIGVMLGVNRTSGLVASRSSSRSIRSRR